MAVGRELILTIRAQNYASATLRRVGRDLANLSRQEDLAVARRRASLARDSIRNQQTQVQQQIRSLEVGKRAVIEQQRLQAAVVREGEARLRNMRIQEREIALQRQQATAQASLLRRQFARVSPAARRTGMLGSAQVKDLEAANLRVKELQQAELRLAEIRKVEQSRLQGESLALQKLNAELGENADKVRLLQSRLTVLAEKEQLATLKMNELAAAQSRIRFERLQTMSQTLSHLGRAAQLAGVITVAAFGLMGKAAADFQTQATLAATQAQTPVETVQQQSGFIQKSTLDLMRQFPATSEEVTKSFYDIFSSMDVGREKALRLEKGFNTLAVAGMAPLEDVTNAGITILNNFADAAANPEKALNDVLATVRFGRTTLQQYTGTLTQLVPAFKNAGQTSREMNAALAETTRLIPSQRASGVGLARLTEMFGSPKFAANAKNIGIEVRNAAGRMIPFHQIIDNIARSSNPLAKGLRDGTVSAQQFFKELTGSQGTIQGRRVFIQLINHAGELDKRYRQLGTDTGELNRSFKNLRNSPGVQWAVVVNTFKAVAIEIGYGVVPAVQRLLKAVQPVTDWFQQLSPQTKRTIGEFGLLAGVFLTVGGVLAVIIGAFGSAYAAIRLFLLGSGGLAQLGAETGAVSRLVLLRTTLVGIGIVIAPLLVRFIGLHNTIQLLMAVVASVAILRFLGTLRAMAGILPLLIGRLGAAGAQATLTGEQIAIAEKEAAAFAATLRAIALIGVITIVIELIVHRKAAAKAIDDVLSHLPGYNKSAAHRALSKIAGEDTDASRKAFEQNAQRIFGDPKVPTVPPQRIVSAPGTVSEHGDALIQLNKNQKAWWEKIKKTGKTDVAGAPVAFSDADTMKAIKNIMRLDAAYAKNPSLKGAREKAAALNALQKKLNSDQFAAAQELISSLESADTKHTKKAVSEAKKRSKDLAAERKKAKEAAQQDIQQIAQTLSSTYDQLRQQNQSAMGTLFQGPFVSGARTQERLQFGGKLTGHDLLTDLRAMVSRFNQWRRALGQLQKRGVPFELYQQILQLGPDALPEIRALLSLNPKEFQQYTNVFRQGQRAVERASQRDMSVNLRHWKSLGASIMKAILSGMDEHTAQFQQYFKNLAASLYPGIAAKAAGKGKGKGSLVPGGLYGATVGGPPIRDRGAPSGEHSVTYQIYPKETDVSTALVKAKNHYRNTYGRGKH